MYKDVQSTPRYIRWKKTRRPLAYNDTNTRTHLPICFNEPRLREASVICRALFTSSIVTGGRTSYFITWILHNVARLYSERVCPASELPPSGAASVHLLDGSVALAFGGGASSVMRIYGLAARAGARHTHNVQLVDDDAPIKICARAKRQNQLRCTQCTASE